MRTAFPVGALRSLISCGGNCQGRGRRRARGAALPLVLWLITLLIAIVGAFALSSRTERLQGRVLAEGSQGRESARAGIDYAMQRLHSPVPQDRWVGDGRLYRWSFADAEVKIRIVDASGKIDLNRADVALLAALLREVGADEAASMQVAGALVDWRDADALLAPAGGAEDPAYRDAGLPYGAKDAPFQSLGELYQVRGMTPDLVARVIPYLTLHSGLAQPDPRFAPPRVLRAMGLDAARFDRQADIPGVSGSGTYSIESHVTLANGREVVMRATLRSGAVHEGAAYAVLDLGGGTR